MSKIIHFICEGQTEDAFVNNVLKPYLKDLDLVAKTLIVRTSRSSAGGIVNYAKLKNDLTQAMKSYRDNEYDKHYFTTMIDLYALPNDFPIYGEAMALHNSYIKISALEEAFNADINFHKFKAYIITKYMEAE